MCQSNLQLSECIEAAQKWDIERLFSKLAVVKKDLKPNSKGLSDFESQCLCLLLLDFEFEEIAQKINRSLNSLKVDLSKNLYQYINILTNQKINDWRDVSRFLEREGYKKNVSTTGRATMQIVLNINMNEVNSQDLEAILENLRKLSGDTSVNITKTEPGSLVLFLEGSPEGLERLESLFKAGQLSELLGFPVREVHYTSADSPAITPTQICVNLSQWFEGIFEIGWQSIEELFGSDALNPAFNLRRVDISKEKSVRRVKLIDWGTQPEGQAVVLLMTLTPDSTQKLSISVQLYPTKDFTYLPPNLRLALLSESGETLQEVRSRSLSIKESQIQDNCIQLKRFKCPSGATFKIEVTLGDSSSTEVFVV